MWNVKVENFITLLRLYKMYNKIKIPSIYTNSKTNMLFTEHDEHMVNDSLSHA